MTPFVSGDHMEAGGETEPHAANEGVRESYACEIDVGIRPQEITNVTLRRDEAGEGVRERRPYARAYLARRLALEAGTHWRLEVADEPAADEARFCGPSATTAVSTRADRSRTHRREIHDVAGGQMIETFGDAPRPGIGAPCSLRFRQAVDQRTRVTFGNVERVLQRLKIRRQSRHAALGNLERLATTADRADFRAAHGRCG